MTNFLILRNLCIFLSLSSLGCVEDKVIATYEYEIPSLGHDLGYIPYDAKFDNPNYVICDSTIFNSGRNRIRYIEGTNKFKEKIRSKFLSKKEYETFNGYIVIRFLVNCEGESGRYRAQSLNLDFSPLSAPSDLLNYSIGLVRSLDNWVKSPAKDNKKEYLKFINLKIKDGKVQHIMF